ncbi:MAG: glycine cleavage system protein GcvH [Bacteroidota bacterium]
MKKIHPTAKYFETNEWARLEGDYFTIGITDFAQTVFGDITFIELPKIGTSFQQGKPFAITESSKAANDIFMPLSGEIMAVNEVLLENPAWLNKAPYDQGWIAKIKANDLSEWKQLMTAEQYADYIGAFFKKT